MERWLTAHPLPAPVQRCVSELLTQRGGAHASVQRLRGALRQVARQEPYAAVVEALAAQPGVGQFTAIRFVLEIGDIHRFGRAEALPNYLGLTPHEYSSGELVHRGHLRKCGPGSLRAWLIQCAWVAVRPGGDPALRECFERLAPRLGTKRAIVAVARRLALRLRARWLAAASEVAHAA